MPVGRHRRHDQAGEHQVHAHELHRRRHDDGEQHVEADAADALAPFEPDQREDGRQHRGADQLTRRHPEDLTRQQVLEVLAAVRIVGEQQDLRGRCEHEQDADQRLLHFGALALGPGEQQRAGQCGGARRRLRAPAFDGQLEAVGRDHAETGDLRDREVDEHDAARQHLLSERHMRNRHQHAGDQRRPQDAEIGEHRVHLHRQQFVEGVVEQSEQVLRLGRAADRERQHHRRRVHALGQPVRRPWDRCTH